MIAAELIVEVLKHGASTLVAEIVIEETVHKLPEGWHRTIIRKVVPRHSDPYARAAPDNSLMAKLRRIWFPE